jgi:hypothetical protein
MKRFLLHSLLAALTVFFTLPEAPVYGQSYYRRTTRQSSRRQHRSTWAPTRRPRRHEVDRRMGFYLGGGPLLDVVGRGDTKSIELDRAGGGFDLFLGWRINPFFALEVGYSMSVHGTSDDFDDFNRAILNGLSLDGRIFFMPSARRLEPYIQLGGGAYGVHEDRQESKWMSGGGLHGGGGIDLHLSRVLAIGVKVLYKGLWMDNGSETEAATKRVFHNHVTTEANLSLHF